MLSSNDKRILLAIAEVATPAGKNVPVPSAATLEGAQAVLDHLGPGVARGYRLLLRALDLAAVPIAGRRLGSLEPEPRLRVLSALHEGSTYWGVRAVVSPLKMAQARHPAVAEAVGAAPSPRLAVLGETPRWQAQVVDARELGDEELEVDAVVVGTGAGGAPLAKALAGAGYAVLMLEEGGHFTRRDFGGDPVDMHRRLYRDRGLTMSLGNAMIPIPMGNTVGGSTTVNSGTCFRAPDRVLSRWQSEQGLAELGPGSLDPYFERVERMLEVAPAEAKTLGGVASLIAKGCEALGYAHGALPRNAPGCDAQALCCYGCPTDAKRSTNVSYVPAALERGAMVYTHARVVEVLTEGRRAVGVVAQTQRADGSQGRITVRAKAVVLSCGTTYTPALLLKQGLANSSGQLGRNLTIHPASYSWALGEEPVRGWAEIPQGYGVEQFVDEGIRYEGGFVPLPVAAAFYGAIGRPWTDMVERFDHLAQFGFMIADTSRGRVTAAAGGRPRITYWLNDADRLKIIRGHAILARVYLAGGAREVYPGMRHFDLLRTEDDVRRLEVEGPAKLKAHHFDLSAFHPLGTCRMGSDPSDSVVGPSHESHDLTGLFISDGSTVSGPLGVNPQVTIMAMSERASEFVARRIDQSIERPLVSVPSVSERISFSETMTGSCELTEGDDAGREVAISFQVHVSLPEGEASLLSALARGGPWRLAGTLDWGGLAEAVPCEGTLLMRPLKGESALVYDLRFVADDGRRYSLHGEKNTSLLRPLRGMTTLFTEVRRDEDDVVVARGVLRFELADLAPWLASWRLGSAA